MSESILQYSRNFLDFDLDCEKSSLILVFIKYDSDNFSITDMTEADCRAVNCSEIDLSTCRPFPYESYSNETEEYLAEDQINLYDEDGCFYTDMLRSTRRYETYMNFSLCMGILTIGKSLLSTLNISRSTLKYF